MSSPPGAAVEVRSLRKSFGPVDAVRDVTFSLGRGEVLGFLGPNGAGKSTTMKMITGYIPVSSGEIRVCGHDIQREPIVSKQQIGYLPEGSPLYGEMTPNALLKFVGVVRGLSGADRRRRIAEVVGALELERVMFQPIDTLSKGYKRRVGLAQAVLHDPEVLILDEPTDGLDPNQKHQVRQLIRTLGTRKAIIISTHLLEEVDAVCDRAIIIDRGRIVFEGTPAELHAKSPNHNAVLVRVGTADVKRSMAALRTIEGLASLDSEDGPDKTSSIIMRPKHGASVADAVGATLRGIGVNVLEMSIQPGRLDEVFRQVTSQPKAPVH